MNETAQKRVNEINETLLGKIVKRNILRTKKGYVAHGSSGGVIFTNSPQHAAPQKDKLLQKLKIAYPKLLYEVEETEVRVDTLSAFERDDLETEKKSLELGYESVAAMKDAKKKKEKNELEIFEQSVFNELLGVKFYAHGCGDLVYERSKVARAIADEAVRQGAALYHVSEEKEKETSFYLEKNGVKVRVSNHCLVFCTELT